MMRRRTMTVGRMMTWIIAAALVLWVARPAVSILLVDGVGSHSHPRLPLVWTAEQGRPMCGLLGRAPDYAHPDPFWPHYWRSLVGQPWPGGYECPLEPPGRVTDRPPKFPGMVSADEY
jgi:hypothetical protein